MDSVINHDKALRVMAPFVRNHKIRYPTGHPSQPEMIDPKTPTIVERPRSPSLSSIANVTEFPEIIVPAGLTKEKMPVTH